MRGDGMEHVVRVGGGCEKVERVGERRGGKAEAVDGPSNSPHAQTKRHAGVKSCRKW
jgi:hypothetical protein